MIGVTASIDYIGLLLGPVVVGQIASFTDLRAAIGAPVVVALAVSLAALRMPAAANDHTGRARSAERT